MLAVLRKFPDFTFEQARSKAHELLSSAAGKRVYRVPPVLTEAEREARREAVRARFAGSESTRTAPPVRGQSHFQCKGSEEAKPHVVGREPGKFEELSK
jgi:hypothetical protein